MMYHCNNCKFIDNGKLFPSRTGKIDVLFLGHHPTKNEIRCGHFSTDAMPYLREKIIDYYYRQQSKLPIISFAYTCSCIPEYDSYKKAYKVSNTMLKSCKDNLLNYITESSPKIIVAFGKDAASALGILSKGRGIICLDISGNRTYVIMTSDNMDNNKVDRIEEDVRKAFSLLHKELPNLTTTVVTPTDAVSVISNLEYICSHISKYHEKYPSGKMLLAVDTETTSLTPYIPTDRMIVISMSWTNCTGLAYPWQHSSVPYSESEFSKIKELTEQILSSPYVKLVFANARFDFQWLNLHCGLTMNSISYDTLLIEHALHESRRGEYSLKDITRLRLPSLGDYEEELHNYMGKDSKFESVSIDILLKYAAMDAIVTRLCFISQFEELKTPEQGILAYNKEHTDNPLIIPSILEPITKISMPLCHVLAEMEYTGILVDRDKIYRFKNQCENRLVELQDIIYKEAGYEFNINSTDELCKLLYDEKKLQVILYTDTGKPSTDSNTLNNLYFDSKLPLLKYLSEYKDITKVSGSFLKNWLELSELDGRIHASFLQHGTETARLSCREPNLQQVPAFLDALGINLKSVFLPDDGFEIYNLDISSAELRVLTAYSQDEALIEAFNSGKDLHCVNAAAISNFTYEDILAHKDDKHSEQHRIRQIGKKVAFGTVYGISASGLARQLRDELHTKITDKECQGYLDNFFKQYIDVKKYIDETREFVRKYRFVYTLTGRRRRFNPYTLDRKELAAIQRAGVNTRIQSTSADLVYYNMIDMNDYVKKLGGSILLQVHDSIVLQLPKGQTGLKKDFDRIIIDNTRERTPFLPVVWQYSAECGTNYGEMTAIS